MKNEELQALDEKIPTRFPEEVSGATLHLPQVITLLRVSILQKKKEKEQ